MLRSGPPLGDHPVSGDFLKHAGPPSDREFAKISVCAEAEILIAIIAIRKCEEHTTIKLELIHNTIGSRYCIRSIKSKTGKCYVEIANT